MATIHVSPLAGQQSLAGRVAGDLFWSRIQATVRSLPPDAKVTIDLRGIIGITDSYFSAAFWPIWSQPQHLTPVFINAELDVEADVDTTLRKWGASVWSVHHDRAAHRVLGELSAEDLQTLDACANSGPATASFLHGAFPNVGRTAWSNRLNALYDRRLLTRSKDGRALAHLLPWPEEVEHG